MKRRKRSKRIRLVLLSGFSAGALAGCSRTEVPVITTENVYANNYYLPGVGYYHAPFNAWYQHPYNYFDPQKKIYFYGGKWGPTPFESIINVSSPTSQAATGAEAARADITRGGFGGTSGGYGFYG